MAGFHREKQKTPSKKMLRMKANESRLKTPLHPRDKNKEQHYDISDQGQRVAQPSLYTLKTNDIQAETKRSTIMEAGRQWSLKLLRQNVL